MTTYGTHAGRQRGARTMRTSVTVGRYLLIPSEHGQAGRQADRQAGRQAGLRIDHTAWIKKKIALLFEVKNCNQRQHVGLT